MNIWNDTKYNLTLIRKNIGFSALCVSVISLGVAISLILYTISFDSSFDVPEADRIIAFQEESDGIINPFAFDAFQYDYFRKNTSSFEYLTAWRNTNVILSDGEVASSFLAAEIDETFFQSMGVQPVMGRLFTSEDIRGGAQQVAIISQDVWENYYTGRKDIIGLRTRINGENMTVIGVMAEGMTLPISNKIWIPLLLPANPVPNQGAQDYVISGRLNQNIDIKSAGQEVQAVNSQINANWVKDYTETNTVTVVPYVEMQTPAGTETFILICIVTILALVIFNVSNLFLSRGVERMQELAIRASLGATPMKVAQALMQESLLVCVMGLVLGLFITVPGLNYFDGLLISVNPSDTDLFWRDFSIHFPQIIVAIAITLVVWFFSGCLPALRVSKTDLNDILLSGGKGVNSMQSSRLNKILVNIQVLFSCTLLIVGMAVLTTGMSWKSDSYGVDSTNKYTAKISLTTTTYSDPQSRLNYMDALRQELLGQSSVREVAFSSALPANGGQTIFYNIEDRDLLNNNKYPSEFQLSVSDNYFELMNVRLIAGRAFGPEDSRNSLPVAIVDRRVVDLLWPGESALQKRIQINPESDAEWVTVVGVTDIIVQDGMSSDISNGTPVIYRPLRQQTPLEVFTVFSSFQSNADSAQAVRSATLRTDRNIPVASTMSLEEVIENGFNYTTGGQIGGSILLSLMVVALIVTAASTYGLAARAVMRRRIEIGIRSALGSTNFQILKVFLKSALFTIVIGLSIGGILGIFMAQYMFSLLSTPNPGAYLLFSSSLVCALLGSLILLANYFPVKSITSMEPGDALRYE